MITKTQTLKKAVALIALVVVVAINSLIPNRALATSNDVPGTLDVAFDGDGLTTIAVGSYSNASSIAIQSDGRIVLAGYYAFNGYGDFAAVRLNEDGSLDTTFDTDGKVITNFAGFSEDVATDIAIQSDGKIILAGYSFGISTSRTFSLVRYNGDGSLDTTFDADGKLTTDLSSYSDSGHAIALQPDGKILVVGYTSNGSNNDIALVRYNADGSLDTTFGTGGVVKTDNNNGGDVGFDVAVLSNGKIIVGGRTASFGSTYLTLVCYNNNGSLDTNFGLNGIVSLYAGAGEVHDGDISVQNDKILLAGYGNSLNTLYLARYHGNGSPDTTFDSDGIVSVDLTGDNMSLGGFAVQSNGKIVVAGSGKYKSDFDLALIRINVDGSLDASFDGDGKLFTDFGSSQNEYGRAIAIQSDGKIVAAGARQNTADVSEFAIARYLSGGADIPPTNTATITPTPISYLMPTPITPRPRPFLKSQVLTPSLLTTQSGTTSGSLSSLNLLEQSGMDENPSAYISFQTSNGVYLGYQSFTLPDDAQTNLVSTMLLQVNFKGPVSSAQIWTWSIYDWKSNMWIKVGDSIGTVTDQWQSLVFRVRQPWRYISSGHEIRIQLRSSNTNGDAKVDYQALHITYLYVPTIPTPAMPTVTPRGPGVFSAPNDVPTSTPNPILNP